MALSDGIKNAHTAIRIIAAPDIMNAFGTPMASAIKPVCSNPKTEGRSVRLPYIENTLPITAISTLVWITTMNDAEYNAMLIPPAKVRPAKM